MLGVYFNHTKSAFAKPIAVATLLIVLINIGLVSRTGYLGGQIRHTEIASGATQNTEEQVGEAEGDAD